MTKENKERGRDRERGEHERNRDRDRGDKVKGKRGANAEGDSGLRERLVHVRRTAKVVKGGRIFGFSVIVVVGDGQGKVGIGQGKAREVPQAIQKATESARRNMRKVELKGSTIFHQVIGRHGATKVVMLPAAEGTGLIAGGAMRAIFEVMGIRDILAKCIGSRSPVNVVRATLNAMDQLINVEAVAARRGLTVKDIFEKE
jgi:small subunit ribosomal protein S5